MTGYPKSPAPDEAPPMGDTGKIYGIQALAQWPVGDAGLPVDVIDVTRATSLWLVHVEGDVLIDLTWGTKATLTLAGLSSPARFAVPGQLTVTARPRLPGPVLTEVKCKVTLTPINGGSCCQILRQFFNTPGAIPDAAAAFFALSASVLTVAGVPVAVPALSRVPLSSGATLTSGDGFLEYEL